MEDSQCLFKLDWQSDHVQAHSPDSPDEHDGTPSFPSAGARHPSHSAPDMVVDTSENISTLSPGRTASESSLEASLSLDNSAACSSDWVGRTSQPSLPLVPRGYQLELLHRACSENIIAFLETGAGKTLISALLIKKTLQDLGADGTALALEIEDSANNNSDAAKDAGNGTAAPSPRAASPCDPAATGSPPHLKNCLAKSVFSFERDAPLTPQASKIAVFLVHRVPLVPQQADFMRSVLPPQIPVGSYHGEKGVDDWSSSRWASSLATKKVLVMTAQIFLNVLRHGLLDIRNVAMLVLDEVHHATKNHPYRRLFLEFYHTLEDDEPHPRVFGMTATPVKAKAAAQSVAPCLDAIVSLETTLDATVVCVSEESLSELEELVPRPEEFVVLYESSGMTMEIDDEETAKLERTAVAKLVDIMAEDHGEQDLVKRSAEQTAWEEGDEDADVNEPDMKMIRFLCWKVGFRAASYFGSRLWSDKGLSTFPLLAVLRRECKSKDLENGGIPDKLCKLLDVLFSECLRSDGKTGIDAENVTTCSSFRCIVFVKERVTAVAVAWLINEVFKELKRPELSAQSVVGAQNSQSHVRMSQTKLLETLDDFRTGSFGILVATNVVEEGIDVPACRLVVAFDPVLSPAAYVQGRGRARKRGARYIAFLEDGSIEHYNAMFNAREGAKLMNLVAGSATATPEERAIHKEKLLEEALGNEPTLYSRTTKARVTATEAVNLLHRYSVMKTSHLKDEDYYYPFYEVHENELGLSTAKVNVHPKVPIDCGVCKNPQESDVLAKRIAALDAYSKLYQLGEVDEFLLPLRPPRPKKILCVFPSYDKDPIGDVGLRPKDKPQRLSTSKASKKDKRLRLCHILHPAATRTLPAAVAHVSQSTATDAPLAGDRGQTCAGDGENLPDAVVPKSVPDEMLLYSIRLDHKTNWLTFQAADCNLMLGIVVNHRLKDEDLKAIRCPAGDDLLTLTYEKSIAWSVEMQDLAYEYVRSIQLCLRGRTPGSSAALDIAAMHYDDNKATGFLLVPLTCPTGPSSVNVDWSSMEKLLSFGWRCGPLEQGECGGLARVENALVCSYHEGLGRVYLSGGLSTKLKANSDPEGLLNSIHKSFVDYFERNHATVIRDKDQAMLECFPVLEKMSRLSTNVFMIPPETCRVIPLPPIMCYVASLLPKWQTFLALRSCWRRNSIDRDISGFVSFARALQPNVNNIAKDCADLSYERLEFLGDAVLKVIYSMAAFVTNPNDDEGALSDVRDVEVSNQKLADIAIEMKIHDCIAFSGVSQKAKSWPWFWGTHQSKPIKVSEKVLADCVEALLGVQYLQGGIAMAAVFMDRHKLLPGVCSVLGLGRNMGLNESILIEAPGKSSCDNRARSAYVREVEDRIKYKFSEKRHLVVALTHGSYRNGYCNSYQRYEYLGDAIIGFVLLSHLFHKYPELGPGELTGLRGPALSNDLFARVIVNLRIHDRFWFDCPPLKAEMKRFEILVANEEDDDDDVCKTMTVPKVLGDLLESIVGAIVVDKGMRLDGVQDIVLNLMDAELERFANPDRFKHNPVSKLVHLAQNACGVLPVYKYFDEASDAVKRCCIFVNENEIGHGEGPTRRIAKHRAALMGLQEMEDKEGQMCDS